MKRRIGLPGTRLLLFVAMTAGMSGVAMADFGGGDSGDSSMNPFTGDSYAYFHGGHNLGEQGTIRPNRVTPPPRAAQDANAPNASLPPATATKRTPEANKSAARVDDNMTRSMPQR